MTTTIYGAADVAQLLRVTRAAVTNYRVRHADTPAAQYVTPDGRAYWSADGMRAWQAWHEARNTSATRQRAYEAVEQLRQTLS